VLDMMQRMPVLRVVGEELVRDKTAQPSEEKKQSKQTKVVDGKAEKPVEETGNAYGPSHSSKQDVAASKATKHY
jgi:hypothetical protein